VRKSGVCGMCWEEKCGERRCWGWEDGCRCEALVGWIDGVLWCCGCSVSLLDLVAITPPLLESLRLRNEMGLMLQAIYI
jgi:hypothetical protein